MAQRPKKTVGKEESKRWKNSRKSRKRGGQLRIPKSQNEIPCPKVLTPKKKLHEKQGLSRPRRLEGGAAFGKPLLRREHVPPGSGHRIESPSSSPKNNKQE